MIQDIFPAKYDNSFEHRRPPMEGDAVLMYNKGCVIGKRGEEEFVFPTVAEVIGICSDHPAAHVPHPFHDEQTELRGGTEKAQGDRYYIGGIEFIYLFRISETAYYAVDQEETVLAYAARAEDCGEAGDLRNLQPKLCAFCAITGLQLKRWRESQRYCGKCGGKMRPSGTERAFICDTCGITNYPKICPAVIVAVTHGDRILLTKYAGRTYTRYALIAGFAEIGETIEETVRREVMEEVGVKVKNLRFYKSQPWSFSDSLLFGFFSELDGEDEHITLDQRELSLGKFVKREEMPVREDDISLTAEMMELFRKGLA